MKKNKVLFIILSFFFCFSVKASGYIAKIGETEYETFDEAINAVGSDVTVIELLQDINEEIEVNIPSGKKVRLDFCDHRVTNINNLGTLTLAGSGVVYNTNSSNGITNSGSLIIDDNISFELLSNQTRAIVNEGNIIIENAIFTDDVEIITPYIVNESNGKMIFNNGRFEYNYRLFINKGEITINDGLFNTLGDNWSNINYGKIKIMDGTFKSEQLSAFIANSGGELAIYGGKFDIFCVAYNADMSEYWIDSSIENKKSIINVYDGEFNVMTAFQNLANAQNSIINILGGNYKVLNNYSITPKYIIQDVSDYTSNEINILAGEIDCTDSKGIRTKNSKIVIGSSEDIASTNSPIIKLGDKSLDNLGEFKISFYAGKINASNDFEVDFDVPENYSIKREAVDDDTVNIYLIKDEKKDTGNNKKDVNKEETSNPLTGLGFKEYLLIVLIIISIISIVFLNKKSFFK